ncbi:MAG: DegV family protein [Clostridiales bacterium]|nr:DegV family protein [Clostridiales bacterium]MDD7365830.1 DegV family protein [Clostridiales bacterium]
MADSFILSCESTVDLPYSYVSGRNIPVLFYSYLANGQEYIDDMGRDPEALPHFYEMLKAGTLPSTSQLNTFQYTEFFEELLKRGDLLHIAFGSGMTGSVKNALEAAEALREKYPERRLIVVDSLCSSSGYGLLVDMAADMRDRGDSMEAIAAWVEQNRNKVHHQFFSTDLKYFKRSGRVSGAAATVGAILNICPIMRLDDKGRIIAYDKVRGKKNAIRETLRTMEAHVQDGVNYAGKCFVCHSNCPVEAEETKAAVRARFPHISGEIRVCDIGTIIASHCGPGTVAVFFMGDERQPDRKG